MDLTCAFTLGKSPNLSESPILSFIDCGYFSASPGYCENKCKKLGNKYEYLLQIQSLPMARLFDQTISILEVISSS